MIVRPLNERFLQFVPSILVTLYLYRLNLHTRRGGEGIKEGAAVKSKIKIN
jgi:hypothetical protein